MTPSTQKYWLPVVGIDHMKPSCMFMPVSVPITQQDLNVFGMLEATGLLCSHITEINSLLRPDPQGKEGVVGSGQPIPLGVGPQVLLGEVCTSSEIGLLYPPLTSTRSLASHLTIFGIRFPIYKVGILTLPI